ncbi:potassium channel family protein [Microbacterium sp. 2FI]|uniref:potassium channel family protein n=1 Tax=Microbacterium sp. 2FI TaxID=2502193 RepID=UPI0010F8A5FB|nr:potassium channel family protein [Microbacterium sp. 2FI]
MARARERAAARAELKNPAYEIFIGILSILSIANLVLVLVFAADPSLQLILSVMNALFSAIFLGDFIYRIATAPSAGRYFFRGFGWADLLASLPFPQLKILRLFRLLRVVRLLRDLGLRAIWTILIHDRANSALMTLLLMGVLVLQWGSIGVLAIEEDADGANITSASDALWYTMVTISTVGYGDQFPVTNAGRLIGTLIIVVGVGIFGTFTGYLANLFLGPGRAKDETDAEGDADTDAVADAASSGVAGGAAAGAVAVGVAAGADAADADADVPPPQDDRAGDHAERLQELLTRSEENIAEIRRMLADATP